MYYYIHTDGTLHAKPDIVVNPDPVDYFDSPFVRRWRYSSDTPEKPMCMGCLSTPEELEEYRDAAKPEGPPEEGELLTDLETPSEYVIKEEGTYNPKNGHFLCTPCYIRAGMPSSPRGWRCP